MTSSPYLLIIMVDTPWLALSQPNMAATLNSYVSIFSLNSNVMAIHIQSSIVAVRIPPLYLKSWVLLFTFHSFAVPGINKFLIGNEEER